MPMRRWYRAPVFLALIASLATPALAQSSSKSTNQSSQSGLSGIAYRGWGVQVGASSNPDQVYGGFHWDMGEFARNVRFRPLVEFGVGDHATVIQGLAEATYIFSKVQVWKPYVGGDIGVTYVNLQRSQLPPGADNTDTKIALLAVGGVETKLKSGTKFFMELKLGLGSDDQDAKVGAGWTWK